MVNIIYINKFVSPFCSIKYPKTTPVSPLNAAICELTPALEIFSKKHSFYHTRGCIFGIIVKRIVCVFIVIPIFNSSNTPPGKYCNIPITDVPANAPTSKSSHSLLQEMKLDSIVTNVIFALYLTVNRLSSYTYLDN